MDKLTDAAYLRKFIMLKPYTAGQNLKGYLKLEVRNGIGKTEINVDGFKNIKEEDVLNAYLMAKKQEEVVMAKIGAIDIRQNGKGNLKWEFNPKSVDDTGLAVEDFDVILIESGKKNHRLADVKLTGELKETDDDLTGLVNQFSSLKKSMNFEEKNIEEEAVKTDTTYNTVDYNKPDTVEKADSFKQQDNINNESEQQQIIENNQIQHADDIALENKDDIKYADPENGYDKIQFADKDETLENQQTEATHLTEEGMVHQNESKEPTETDNQETEVKYLTEEDMVKEGDSSDETITAEQAINNIGNELPSGDEKELDYKAFDEEHKQNIENFYGYSVNKTYNYMQNALNYKDQVYSYTKNILKFFENADVLKTRLEGYKWWKIEYSSKDNYYRTFLPFHNYILNNSVPYPSMFNVTPTYKLIKKYKHYIFGIMRVNKDLKYYVYGIPGRFTKTEQPYGGMTGFCTWCPRKGLNREKLGYWLLHIDCLTGRNARPLKPTPPR
ncbi:hypothetical protein PV797_21330 [Clostridiaceae bacterium M8S5]|nr:hypothetical protein PV797_21330 [Clostridiaceae bacterium M8S5]